VDRYLGVNAADFGSTRQIPASHPHQRSKVREKSNIAEQLGANFGSFGNENLPPKDCTSKMEG
jgi:hypothetical protein